MNMPARKRFFDLALIIITLPVWLPVLLLVILVQALCEGRPIFYPSLRRVHGQRQAYTWKFRTMVRNAAQLYNRDTVPVSGQRFLNLPIDSPLYTRSGRFIERCQFTELPQIFLVITGTMSIVGNRPLPENVIRSLAEVHQNVEARFNSPGGLTGLTQLVGREALNDGDRLTLEARYCDAVKHHYAMRLDFLILSYTVLIHCRLMQSLGVEEAHSLLDGFAPRQQATDQNAPDDSQADGFGVIGGKEQP